MRRDARTDRGRQKNNEMRNCDPLEGARKVEIALGGQRLHPGGHRDFRWGTTAAMPSYHCCAMNV